MTSALPRRLTLVSSIAIVVSNMIGVGIFGATGFLAGDLGQPAWVLGVWLAGAIIAMAGCLSYAEMGINLPRSGGEYVYVRKAWGPMWGFLSGWISFFAGFSAPIAAGALLFSDYLGHFFPALASPPQEGASAVPAHLLQLGWRQATALGVIALFTVVNILGMALAARIQTVLAAVKVLVLGSFVVLTFWVGRGDWQNLSQATTRTSPHSLVAQVAISLIFVMYAYSGWNAATYVAEEIREPVRTLPRALITGTTIVAALYVAVNTAFIYALPLESLKGVQRVGAAAATALFRGAGGDVFAGVMAACILSTVSAMVIVGPRVYYAMAVDGCFFADAARIHPRWQTPSRAILYQAIAAGLMVITATFSGLAYYIGSTLVLFAALAAAGGIRLRDCAGWKRLPALDFAFPLIPGVFILASLWMLIYTFWLRPDVLLACAVTLLVGMAVYRFRFRRAENARPQHRNEAN